MGRRRGAAVPWIPERRVVGRAARGIHALALTPARPAKAPRHCTTNDRRSTMSDQLLTAHRDDVPATDRVARRRYGVIGTGARSQMYIKALVGDHADVGDLVAWCEPNPGRMDYADSVVAGRRQGAPLPTRFGPLEVERMVAEERLDVVVITTPDWTHADIASRAMRAGADVVLEKPLTTDLAGCHAIVNALEQTGRSLVLTFNYRYSPRNAALKEVTSSGEIGEVTSVHFERPLGSTPGADYFRRWHREKQNSAGLVVHKASHHFDLVNWWL